MFFLYVYLEQVAYDYIKKNCAKLGLKYFCVADKIDPKNAMRRLDIQILLHEEKTIRQPFMDECLGMYF
jgi:hypothetical protein